jgi:hypothetical protein
MKNFYLNIVVRMIHVIDLGPVCLGCLWLAVHGKLLCRESCCPEKAVVSNFTVW